MRATQVSFAFPLVFALLLSFPPSPNAAPGQAEIEISQDTEIEDEQAKWNSHINNQAYLQELEERRKDQILRYSQTSPTIIINRSSRSGCLAEDCDSWGVRYQSGDTTFIYQENYQPVRIYPVIIDPYGKYPRHPAYSDRLRNKDTKK